MSKSRKVDLLICAALKTEVKPLLERVKIVDYVPIGVGHLYRVEVKNREFAILRTGVGTEKSAKTLRLILQEMNVRNVLNIGTCGSLSDRVSVGAPLAIKSIVDEENNRYECDMKWINKFDYEWETAKLVTAREGIVSRKQKREIIRLTDASIVDMEAAALAKICGEFGIHFSALKIATDFADHLAASHFKSNLLKTSKRLSRIVVKLLEKWHENG